MQEGLCVFVTIAFYFSTAYKNTRTKWVRRHRKNARD